MISRLKKNFTMIELLAAVCIIAILIAMVSGIAGMVGRKNAEAETVAVIKALDTAFAMHKAKYGYVPCYNGSTTPDGVTKYNHTSGGKQGYVTVMLNSDHSATIWEFLDYEYIKKHSTLSGSYFIVNDGFDAPVYYKVPGFYKNGSWDIVSMGELRGKVMVWNGNGEMWAPRTPLERDLVPLKVTADVLAGNNACAYLYFGQPQYYINNFGY